jgi:NADH-quinone oxidoreductase subunit F
VNENFHTVLLKRVEQHANPGLEAYRADGGYTGLRVALQLSPADVIEKVKQSGLRGRGGAGFPTGMKWSFLPKDHPGPIYLAVNADESEPGTFNNRVLMEKDPHQLLEGIAIACRAIGAKTAYIYLRYEYGRSYRTLQRAIDECYAAGILGPRVLDTEQSLDIRLHRGAGAYICGEETGLIESLEGKRAWPRIKPPFPAVEGLFRKPTIVNNVETIACVTHIFARGPEWFRSMGVAPDPSNPRDLGSYGPKLYGVSGHVERQGLFELPLGVTSRELIDRCGGIWKGRNVKAVIPGGLSTGFLTADEMDVPLDFSGPVKAGCLGLGTAGLIVIDDQTNIVDVLFNSSRFYAHESCGQCTPCREGTRWMEKILERFRNGEGTERDIDLLIEVSETMGIIPGTTICGLADGAAWPVKSALKKFRGDFVEYVRSGRRAPASRLALAH